MSPQNGRRGYCAKYCTTDPVGQYGQKAQKEEDIEYRAKMDNNLSGETADPMPPPSPFPPYGSFYQHGNTSPTSPKAHWSHTQNRKTTVLGHFSIKTYSHLCTEGGVGEERNLDSLADNLSHRLKFTFLCQTIPIACYSTLFHDRKARQYTIYSRIVHRPDFLPIATGSAVRIWRNILVFHFVGSSICPYNSCIYIWFGASRID